MATALENNGATVYIVGRRPEILRKAARENSVSSFNFSFDPKKKSKQSNFAVFDGTLIFFFFFFLKQKFDKIIPLEADITDRASLLAIAETVKAEQGYIDLLVNNAGIARNLFPHPLPSPDASNISHPPSPPASPGPNSSAPSIKAFQNVLWDCGSPEDFAETFSINTTAVYYTTIAFLDLLHQGNIRRQRLACQTTAPNLARPPYHTSQVLSVSSSGSFRIDSRVLSPSYTLSKNACTHLGKLLANLLAPWGIRSNVLAPGVWPSGMFIIGIS